MCFPSWHFHKKLGRFRLFYWILVFWTTPTTILSSKFKDNPKFVSLYNFVRVVWWCKFISISFMQLFHSTKKMLQNFHSRVVETNSKAKSFLWYLTEYALANRKYLKSYSLQIVSTSNANLEFNNSSDTSFHSTMFFNFPLYHWIHRQQAYNTLIDTDQTNMR